MSKNKSTNSVYAQIATKVAQLIEKHATSNPNDRFYGRLTTWMDRDFDGVKTSLNAILRLTYPNVVPAKNSDKEANKAALNAFWDKVCAASNGMLERRQTQVAHTKYVAPKPVEKTLDLPTAKALLG